MSIRIGVFDSGVGGLASLQFLREQLLPQDFIYFADTAYFPYGMKPGAVIIDRVLKAVEYLVNQKGITHLLVACNTASVYAIPFIKQAFPFLAIKGVVEESAQKAVSLSLSGHISLIGTKMTVLSSFYDSLIKRLDPKAKITSYACPTLVELVEEGLLTSNRTDIVLNGLQPFLNNLLPSQDTLILACTHFSFLKEEIQKAIRTPLTLIDSAEVTPHSFIPSPLISVLSGAMEFYVTHDSKKFSETASHLLKEKIIAQEVKIKDAPLEIEARSNF